MCRRNRTQSILIRPVMEGPEYRQQGDGSVRERVFNARWDLSTSARSWVRAASVSAEPEDRELAARTLVGEAFDHEFNKTAKTRLSAHVPVVPKPGIPRGRGATQVYARNARCRIAQRERQHRQSDTKGA
jgi:hypothetical protein